MRFAHGEEAWEAFVAALDAEKVSREWARPPRSGERPGSVADRLMRMAHEMAKEARRMRGGPPMTECELDAVLTEASEYDVAAQRRMPRLAAYRDRMGRKAS